MFELRREDIVFYLSELNEKLKALNISGVIYLVDGAVFTLVHKTRNATQDIDAIYEPKKEISLIINKMAAEYNLNENWLNDGVKGYVNKKNEFPRV